MRRVAIFIVILLGLFVLIGNVQAQELEEEIQSSPIGEWNAQYLNWEDEWIDAGIIIFRENGECTVHNQGTRHFEWELDGRFLFLAKLGYTYEFENEDTLILTPAYGEATMQRLLLERR